MKLFVADTCRHGLKSASNSPRVAGLVSRAECDKASFHRWAGFVVSAQRVVGPARKILLAGLDRWNTSCSLPREKTVIRLYGIDCSPSKLHETARWRASCDVWVGRCGFHSCCCPILMA